MAYEITNDCVACEQCIPECPVGAISLDTTKVLIDSDLCIECGICFEVCPMYAVSDLESWHARS